MAHAAVLLPASLAVIAGGGQGNRAAAHPAAAFPNRRGLSLLNQGIPAVLDRGEPNSYPAFHRFFERIEKLNDLPPMVIRRADRLVPRSRAITDWEYLLGPGRRPDRPANDGADVGGPDDAEARAKAKADIAKFHRDYNKAERAVGRVAAGK